MSQSDRNFSSASQLLTNDVSASRQQELVLVKQDQRFVFRYVVGQEADLLLQMADVVRDPDNPLDWFDAAVLAHKMGQRLGDRLEQMISQ